VLGGLKPFIASDRVRHTGNSNFSDRVSAFREFNRFYTQKIGILREGYLGSLLPLTKVRVLYEIANRKKTTASELSRELALDPGYLSRIIKDYSRKNMIQRSRSMSDGRESILRLTKHGRKTFASLNDRAQIEISDLVRAIPANDQKRLIEAMNTIERVFSPTKSGGTPYVLRNPHPGDLGWIVHRHGTIYAEEYGWNEEFEGLVAKIIAHFIEHFDPKRERFWIAERNNEILGCVCLVKKSAKVAQLRLLLVEPNARGLGIGTRLVQECTIFAKEAGYQRITLWTNSVLLAARNIYQKEGYELKQKERRNMFGHDLVNETWELKLTYSEKQP
jgi:DNA-binding MarR family transcriptional regulator/N-acetylglutamate synthase-like GNAT family acetyltransferase